MTRSFTAAIRQDAIQDRVAAGHLDGAQLPFVQAGDMQTIRAPMDFLGVNYYSRVVMRAGEGATATGRAARCRTKSSTDMGWEVYPSGLTTLLERLHREYAPPRDLHHRERRRILDGPDEAGRIADTRRIAYLQRTYRWRATARSPSGVPLRGYFAWSLLDNFEWGRATTKRFGLFWVDFETQERIPKDSAFWYRDVVAANAVDDAPTPIPRRLP